jgi:hypothetical protein
MPQGDTSTWATGNTLLSLAIRDAFDIDTAAGVQLDTIGLYLGIKRSGFDFSGARALDDSQYRQLLKMMMGRKAMNSSLKSIQEFLNAYLSDAVQVFDDGDMHMSWYYKLANGVNVVSEFFIKAGFLPNPLGVGSEFIYTLDYFGFLEDANAKPFTDTENPAIGGPFVSRYANPNRPPEYGIICGPDTDFGFLEDSPAGTMGDSTDSSLGSPFAYLI